MKSSLAFCLLLASSTSWAARYAIIVGNNQGHGMDAPLRYAESDAKRLASVLKEVGGFDGGHVRVLGSPASEAVERTFVEVAREIEQSHDANALILFYYSGHADGSTLHLGETSLDLARLKQLLADSHAQVRIGVLDACGAGAMTIREKGVEKGAPFMLFAPTELQTRGQVIIAAVSASESAQESDQLRGSFFTNYLVSGLRGAADRGGSGKVTLDDAYHYAYAQTVRATMLSRSGAQHPSYNVDLSGQGDLVLTEPRKARSRLAFRADSRGEFTVFTPTEELIAELSVQSDSQVLLALPPGDYEVRKRAPDGLRFARVRVTEGEERELREPLMQRIEYVHLQRKGFNPRLHFSLGYNYGLLTADSGGGTIRLSLDLAARRLILSPRVSSTIPLLPYVRGPVSVFEAFWAGGLGLSHPWERSRFFFSVGGAVDAGVLYQYTGKTAYAFGLNIAATAVVGMRLFREFSISIEAEPGLLFANTQHVVRPNIHALGGIRYDF